jgi:hypothetical protein
MLPQKLVTREELVAALKERGIKSSPRSVDRLCAAGMPYWTPGNAKRFDVDTSYTFILNRSKVERRPEPSRRGRPRRAA